MTAIAAIQTLALVSRLKAGSGLTEFSNRVILAENPKFDGHYLT